MKAFPLKMVDPILWTRESILTDTAEGEKERLRKQPCYEEKESCRWLEMFKAVSKSLAQIQGLTTSMLLTPNQISTILFLEIDH